MIYGVDPSCTCTGVVGLTTLGHAVHTVRPGGARGIKRAQEIAGAVLGSVSKVEFPRLVVIEGYGFGNANSLASLVEVGTLIRDRLWKAGIPYLVVAPTQLKKFVIGKGTGGKDLMRLHVFKRWGFEADSADAVDAYGLARIGRAWMGLDQDLIAPQREVIMKLPVASEGPNPVARRAT